MSDAFSTSSSLASKAALGAAVANSVISTLMDSADASGQGIMLNLVQVGGPTLIGALVANAVSPLPLSSTTDLTALGKRGLIAGLAATAVVTYAGLMDLSLDAQTASFIVLIAGSVALADYVALNYGNMAK